MSTELEELDGKINQALNGRTHNQNIRHEQIMAHFIVNKVTIDIEKQRYNERY